MSKSTITNWSLTQYYDSIYDPRLQSDTQKAQTAVDEYVQKYRGRISNLTPNGMLQAITEIEEICVLINKPCYFLQLTYEAGGDNLEEVAKIQSIFDEKSTLINNQLAFFDVEICGRSDLVELSESEELVKYKHYLEIVAINAKYILSEDVEKVMALRSLTGIDAWSRLYTDQKGKIEIELNIYGTKKKYNVPGLMDLLKSSDRDIRKLAFEALSSCYQDNEELVLEAYNNIMMDKKITDNLRGFANAEESKLVSNQISAEFVQSLVDTCKSKTDWVQRYYRLKNKILGISDPQFFDHYAQIPVGEIKEQEFQWEDCKKIILETFESFHPRFAQIASEAFENNWIDGNLRKRKYSGAFCSSYAPGYHPVILCNYKNKFVDVSTVAHELGHLIHSVLTQENQSLWNCNYTMSMAEIASLCCETIVYEKLFSQVTDKQLKLKLLCEKIEEEAGNIFSGGLGRYTFESKIHAQFRETGAISKEQIRELWLNENFVQVYGDVYNYPEGCQYSWQSVAHFTYIFYNYVYASGLLISSSIYEIIKNSPEHKEIYIQILSAGGSLSPKDMLAKLGLDIESSQFWNIGFKIFEDKIIEAENLFAQIQAEKSDQN
jgi:oligoendopeptidase F